MTYQGKVAVITGASRGIGAGLADELARAGVRLGLCARTMATETTSTRVARAVDVCDGQAVDRFCAEVVDTFGAIDLWINNAGVLAPIGPLRDLDSAAFAQHQAINIHGVFHGSRAFVRHVRANSRPGVLVNISSGAARHAYAGWSAYCASKAAVDRLSECIALEENDTALRVYSVAPGVIDTDMQALIRSTSADDFPMVDRFVKMKANDEFSSIRFVAEQMLELAFGPDAPTEVLTSFAPGK